MTAMPAQMANRWQHRAEPAPDEGTVYWHVLMRDYPQAVELTRQAQRKLAPFGGLHMTPLEWLHITTMVAGPAADLASDQLDQMARTAAGLLADLPPVQVKLGRVLYHPEAITLAVTPRRALSPLREAARAATRQVMNGQILPSAPSAWTPHVTICYSTSDQPAQPIIAALGRQLPECSIQISALSLVVQRGPERHWDWRTVNTIRLATKATA
jgi:2'-5' RNA ligase